jgi:hypothetical protein
MLMVLFSHQQKKHLSNLISISGFKYMDSQSKATHNGIINGCYWIVTNPSSNTTHMFYSLFLDLVNMTLDGEVGR